MRTLKFRIAYQHEETGRITFRSIELGDTIPFVAERWYVIGKDQYTGLSKNGAEIYEGDIVRSVLHTFIGVVYFERGAFWVQEIGTHVDEGVYNGDMQKETTWSIDLDYEVIGTVYQHPELLDSKKEGGQVS